jgi:RNA polymerase sigma-70 factor (ECF subfamily)
MPRTAHAQVTDLLVAWSNGDEAALNSLIPLVYDELHRIAGRHMQQEEPGHTLQTTALVNEGYTRLVELKRVRWQSRAHFFALASRHNGRSLTQAPGGSWWCFTKGYAAGYRRTLRCGQP